MREIRFTMITSAMDLPARVADARKDLKMLWRHVDTLLPVLRLAAHRDPSIGDPMLFPWRSPRNNSWLLRFDRVAGAPALSALTWAIGADGRPFALVVGPKGTSHFIGATAIQWFSERFDPQGDPEERVQSFHYENRLYAVSVRRTMGTDLQEVRIDLDLGVGLGEWDTANDIVHIAHFFSYAELCPERPQAIGRAGAREAWEVLSEAQQSDRIAFAARRSMRVRAA